MSGDVYGNDDYCKHGMQLDIPCPLCEAFRTKDREAATEARIVAEIVAFLRTFRVIEPGTVDTSPLAGVVLRDAADAIETKWRKK